MKVDLFETHDRYKHFTNQNFDISACCQDIINKRPFGEHPFYIFAHARTDEDGFTKRLIWQPRLTKPKSQSNSMLFKAYPGKDTLKIIWIVPAVELWQQYKTGNVTENDLVSKSIYDFIHNRDLLDAPEEDDLPDHIIDQIYREISWNAKPLKFEKI